MGSININTIIQTEQIRQLTEDVKALHDEDNKDKLNDTISQMIDRIKEISKQAKESKENNRTHTPQDLQKEKIKLMRDRLSKKHIEKHCPIESKKQDEDIKKQDEYIKKFIKQINDSSKETPDQIAQNLIREENIIKKQKAAQRSRKTQFKEHHKKIKKKNQKKVLSKKQSPICLRKHTENKKLVEKNVINETDKKLAEFASKLWQTSWNGQLHPRVKRWETTDPEKIRHFSDTRDGKTIYHYKSLSDEEILEQQAKHRLTGIDRILKNSTYKEIYTKTTNRGYAAVAQLIHNNETHNGMIYIGIGKDKVIFHQHFKETNFAHNDTFVDKEEEVQETYQSNDEQWIPSKDFHIDINKNGVLTYSYPTHSYKIYPLSTKLFENTIKKL